MNKKIIPTLFALDKNTFKTKLNKLNFTPKLHIDFMDGTLTPKKSLSLKEIKEEISKFPENSFEIHMMCKNPEKYYDKISQIKNINKIIIHYEGFEDFNKLILSINKFRENKNLNQIFLCFNPDKDSKFILETLSKLFNSNINKIEGIQLMSVVPGAEGQVFIENTLEKIKQIRDKYKTLNIQIDGGVKEQNSSKIISYGANILSIGSFISGSKNPKKTYENLLHLINS